MSPSITVCERSHENAPGHPANTALPENAFTLSKKAGTGFLFPLPGSNDLPVCPGT